jgi:hypothetical protein
MPACRMDGRRKNPARGGTFGKAGRRCAPRCGRVPGGRRHPRWQATDPSPVVTGAGRETGRTMGRWRSPTGLMGKWRRRTPRRSTVAPGGRPIVRDAWASGQIRSEQCRAGAPSSPEHSPWLPEHSTPEKPPPQPLPRCDGRGASTTPTPPPLRRERDPLPNPSTVATGEGLSDRAPVATGEGLSTHPRCSTACRFRRRIGRGEYGACPAGDGGVG